MVRTPLAGHLWHGNVVLSVLQAQQQHALQAAACAGERMQLHRDGDSIQFFSRRGKEHGALSSYDVLDVVVKKAVRHQRCILDGELVVWNKARSGNLLACRLNTRLFHSRCLLGLGGCIWPRSAGQQAAHPLTHLCHLTTHQEMQLLLCRHQFEPFGSIKSSIIAARDGKGPDDFLDMRQGDALMTSDPDYEAPQVPDLLPMGCHHWNAMPPLQAGLVIRNICEPPMSWTLQDFNLGTACCDCLVEARFGTLQSRANKH